MFTNICGDLKTCIFGVVGNVDIDGMDGEASLANGDWKDLLKLDGETKRDRWDEVGVDGLMAWTGTARFTAGLPSSRWIKGDL